MEDHKERVGTCVSTQELERRWKESREVMREQGLDYLMMRSDEEFLGGYVRWFCDVAAGNQYPLTVVFPFDDEMTTISSGSVPPGEPSVPAWAVRGVKKRVSAPYLPSLWYTSALEGELVVEILKEKKGAKIGVVGKSFMSAPFYEYMEKQLIGYTFFDVTDQIDGIKAIKSPEEIQLIKHTAEIQDAAMEHLRGAIRPGMRDFEVMAEAQYSLVKQGSERQLILVGSADPAAPARWQFRQYQNRMIREGDQVAILLEVNGPGGFYTEIGRMFSMGRPSEQLQEAFGVAAELQAATANQLKPGANAKNIWDENNRLLGDRGYLPERRLFAHGQGYSLVERPAIRYDEPMKIQAGMNIAVHPYAINDTVWAVVCDNYLVTEDGMKNVCLHKFPREITVL